MHGKADFLVGEDDDEEADDYAQPLNRDINLM